MRYFGIVILCIGVATCFFQCSKSSSSDGPASFHNVMNDLSPTEVELCNASAEFGIKLFKEIDPLVDPAKNIFFSPISLSICLGMAYNGAAGQTREEIAQALQVSGFSEEEINNGYREIAYLLPIVDPGVEVIIANSIWSHLGFPFYLAFLDICINYFNADTFEVDFYNPSSADLINQWASDNTEGLIDNVVNPNELKGLIWILMNAVYFKGNWTEKSDADNTVEKQFFLDDTSTISCNMMHNEESFLYVENDLFQAVNLPYGEEAFHMTVLLPQPDKSTDEVIDAFTIEDWDAWLQSMQVRTVTLQLPKFKFEFSLDDELITALKAMGMVTAFGAGANFSFMMELPTVIAKVGQSTYVRVDEEGTEAAAVTTLFGASSAPPLYMTVDRPFLFIIHEKVTGSIMFMGKVCKPVWD